MAVGQAGEVGADDRRRGRNGDKAVFGTPSGKMRPVGLVGAQGGPRGGLFRQRLGGGERRFAGRAERRQARRCGGVPGVRRQDVRRAGDRPIRCFDVHAARVAGCVPDSSRKNCTMRDKCDYRR
jgi:hypothetical protein